MQDERAITGVTNNRISEEQAGAPAQTPIPATKQENSTSPLTTPQLQMTRHRKQTNC